MITSSSLSTSSSYFDYCHHYTASLLLNACFFSMNAKDRFCCGPSSIGLTKGIGFISVLEKG